MSKINYIFIYCFIVILRYRIFTGLKIYESQLSFCSKSIKNYFEIKDVIIQHFYEIDIC